MSVTLCKRNLKRVGILSLLLFPLLASSSCSKKEKPDASKSNSEPTEVQKVEISKATDEMPVVVLPPLQKRERAKVEPKTTPRSAPKATQECIPPPVVLPPAAPARKPVLAKVSPPLPVRLFSGRDPFRSYMVSTVAEDFSEPESKRLTQFDVQEFRFVGVILSVNETLALLEDPSGQGHSVQVGTVIGRNHSVVESIGETKVVIRQSAKGSLGKSKASYVTLKLGR